VKASARADKKRMLDSITEEAEVAIDSNIGDLYRLVKQIVQSR